MHSCRREVQLGSKGQGKANQVRVMEVTRDPHGGSASAQAKNHGRERSWPLKGQKRPQKGEGGKEMASEQ